MWYTFLKEAYVNQVQKGLETWFTDLYHLRRDFSPDGSNGISYFKCSSHSVLVILLLSAAGYASSLLEPRKNFVTDLTYRI